jgi:hypothetical protein
MARIQVDVLLGPELPNERPFLRADVTRLGSLGEQSPLEDRDPSRVLVLAPIEGSFHAGEVLWHSSTHKAPIMGGRRSSTSRLRHSPRQKPSTTPHPQHALRFCISGLLWNDLV